MGAALRHSYTVEHADVAAAEVPFVGIWGENLQVKGDPHQQYRWHYVHNPTGAGSAFLLQCQSDQGPSQVVGCCGIGRRTFALHGSPITAALMGDFAVDRGHRTVMPALLLQRTIHRHVRTHFRLAYGFPNASAVGVFRRIGYQEIGPMIRYARVLRHRTYLQRMLPFPVLPWVGGVILDGATRAWQAARSAPARVSRQLLWMNDVDSRFDDLWESVHRAYPILGFRGASFLRWRFMQKPGERFAIAALVERDSQRLRAYAVVQEEDRTVHIRDLLGASEQEIGTLIDQLVLRLSGKDLDAVSIRFLGTPWIRRALLDRGFVPRQGSRSVILQVGDEAGPEAAALHDPQRWYLTDADEDV